MSSKKVFISYSHDNEDHKAWVRQVASLLLGKGIDVILDQWDLRAGEDIPQFVENSILSSDRVLLVCTEKYVEKANLREGGVGLEALVINSSLMEDLGTTKFIAVIKQPKEKPALPNLIKSRLYINLSDEKTFESEIDHLVHEIHEIGHVEKPRVGDNPFASAKPKKKKEKYGVSEDDVINDEIATKLDLSRAYIDMGDIEGAVEVLTEVLNEGNLMQQKEAKELISRVNKKKNDGN